MVYHIKVYTLSMAVVCGEYFPVHGVYFSVHGVCPGEGVEVNQLLVAIPLMDSVHCGLCPV